MDITQHNVTSVTIAKRSYDTFKTVRITVVSEKRGNYEEHEYVIHTNNNKFPKIITKKIEAI